MLESPRIVYRNPNTSIISTRYIAKSEGALIEQLQLLAFHDPSALRAITRFVKHQLANIDAVDNAPVPTPDVPDLRFVLDAHTTTHLGYAEHRPGTLAFSPDAFMHRRVHDVAPPNVALVIDSAIHGARRTGTPATIQYNLGAHIYRGELIVTGELAVLDVSKVV